MGRGKTRRFWAAPTDEPATEPTNATHPRVLLWNVEPADAHWLTTCLENVAVAVTAAGDGAPLGPYAGRLDAVITGLAGADPRLRELLDAVSGHCPVLLLGDGAPVEDDRIFFVLSRKLPASDLVALVTSALVEPGAGSQVPTSPDQAAQVQRVLNLASRFSTRSDLASAAAVAEDATTQLTKAVRSYCLFNDAETGLVWTEGENGREGHAATGLVGFAARTGRRCVVERAADDSRFVGELDDPGGDGEQRLLVQPVVGTDGRVQAVLVAARSPDRRPFSANHCERMARFAEATGPMMQHLARMVEAEAVLRAERERSDGPFRREAVDAYAAQGQRGDVVRVSPQWIQWAYWVLLGLAVASIAHLCVGKVEHYSAGPAIVRLHNRTEVPAQGSGALMSIEVDSGERVEAGQLLARLDDSEARAAAERLQHEFDDQLRNHLLDPEDVAATNAVFSLRGQLAAARTMVELREIRASTAGIVSDIRIRPGQHIGVGEIVLSLLDDDYDPHVVALLAGSDRPQLRPGQQLRIEIDGYPYAYQSLVVDGVGTDIIGPSEAARYLGPQAADTLAVAGPLVLVRARLDHATFVADGEAFEFHDGMVAQAEVAIRSEPIIVMLFPFLKWWQTNV